MYDAFYGGDMNTLRKKMGPEIDTLRKKEISMAINVTKRSEISGTKRNVKIPRRQPQSLRNRIINNFMEVIKR